MKNSRTLSIFDFDRTLVENDSFRLFSLLAAKKISMKALMFLFAVLNKTALITNRRYKELVLRSVWVARDKKEKTIVLSRLFSRLKAVEYPEVVRCMQKHIYRGDRVIVLSASPSFYLKPYVKLWSETIEVFGSELEVVNGNVRLHNLYGLKKALIAKSIIEQMKPNTVWVYTDSISDLPVIRLADRIMLVNPKTNLCQKLHQLNLVYEIVS